MKEVRALISPIVSLLLNKSLADNNNNNNNDPESEISGSGKIMTIFTSFGTPFRFLTLFLY